MPDNSADAHAHPITSAHDISSVNQPGAYQAPDSGPVVKPDRYTSSRGSHLG